MSTLEKKQPLPDPEREAILYLQENPDFFSRHPAVLESLFLPHNSGSAVSLIEKQMTVLRERNTRLRGRLNELMELSKANDDLFSKTRDLVLHLIDAADARTIAETLVGRFGNDFGIEFASLTLIDRELATPAVNHLSGDAARDTLSSILETDGATCGALRSQQLIALFGNETARLVGSAVTMRLAAGKDAYGVVALGNSDSHHYHAGMDTLFLKFVVDILNRVLYPRL